MRRNGLLTVRGVWKRPFNILVTNCGEYVVVNWRIWYKNPESYFVLQANKKGEYFIQKCIHLDGKIE